MHPVDAWFNSGKIAVFSGIFAGLPAGQFRAPAGINQALCGGVFFLIIHPRSRVGPESDGC